MSSSCTNQDSNSGAAILLWDEQLDDLDYYALLGVTDQDSILDYERAYHRFALQFHPDGHPNDDARIRGALTRIFQRGVEARRVLSDPELHARYKLALQRGDKRQVDDSPVVAIDLAQELPELHVRCRSAGAKLEAMAAARAWKNKDFALVRQRLVSALAHDGHANPVVEQCVEAVSRVLLEFRASASPHQGG